MQLDQPDFTETCAARRSRVEAVADQQRERPQQSRRTPCFSEVPNSAAGLELYTRAEVAAILKIKESWLRDNQSRVPCTRIGRQVRYTRADVEQIVAMGRSSTTTVENIAVIPTVLTPVPKRVRQPSDGHPRRSA